MKPRPKVDLWFVSCRMAWIFMIILVLLTAAYTIHFAMNRNWTGQRIAAPLFPDHVLIGNAILLFHIFTALPALLIGPGQFLPGFRNRWARLHRGMGKVYIICILISAVSGFSLATANEFGWVARAGFMSLAVAWFVTTWLAMQHIRKGEIHEHRRWMIRSYAITLATVTVRFIQAPYGLPAEIWYPIMTWLCWVPNLIAAEAYLRMTTHFGRLKKRRASLEPVALGS